MPPCHLPLFLAFISYSFFYFFPSKGRSATGRSNRRPVPPHQRGAGRRAAPKPHFPLPRGADAPPSSRTLLRARARTDEAGQRRACATRPPVLPPSAALLTPLPPHSRAHGGGESARGGGAAPLAAGGAEAAAPGPCGAAVSAQPPPSRVLFAARLRQESFALVPAPFPAGAGRAGAPLSPPSRRAAAGGRAAEGRGGRGST